MFIILCGRPGGCRPVKLPDSPPEQARAFLHAWQAARDAGGDPSQSPTVQDLAVGQLPLFDLSGYVRRREH